MNCRICPDDRCTPAYHAASANIRRWLRARVKLYLAPLEPGERGMRGMPVTFGKNK